MKGYLIKQEGNGWQAILGQPHNPVFRIGPYDTAFIAHSMLRQKANRIGYESNNLNKPPKALGEAMIELSFTDNRMISE